MSRATQSLAVLGLAAVLAGVADAQEPTWRGSGRAVGVVIDLDDRPVSAAEVTLRPVASSAQGPPSVRTGADGSWSIAGLAPGRWTLTVKATGYRTGDGWIDVPENGSTSLVSMALRPLAEVTPAFAEHAGSVLRWIEKANDLLEQGHCREARAEYEKALGRLPVDSRPEVLRAIARTYFLEGDSEAAVQTLRQALTLAPGDPTTRQLFTVLLTQLGRADEAEQLLADLERHGTEAWRDASEDRGASERMAGTLAALPAEIAALPVEPPVADRRGRYRTRLSDRSPHAATGEILRRLGTARAQVERILAEDGDYDLSQESFHVVVPGGRSPADGFGVLVYVSPGSFGGFERDEVGQLLEEHRLIWIGADDAGNRRPRWQRMALALNAVHNLDRLYRVDARRVYISGYSGGGRVASSLALLYPEVFRGGLSLFGCDYFGRLDRPDKPGAYWPSRFPPPPPDALRQVRSRSGFVLLTGELDFNRVQTQATYRQMLADGFEHVSLLVIPEAGHYHAVEREWLERGIRALDAAVGAAEPRR